MDVRHKKTQMKDVGRLGTFDMHDHIVTYYYFHIYKVISVVIVPTPRPMRFWGSPGISNGAVLVSLTQFRHNL